MRYFLTILAILVILVFTAALAVPYFVNWNDQRAVVAAHISDILGARVKIDGSIDLKLLPTPYLTLGAVEIADPSGKTTATIAEIRLEIALAALMRGDVDFIEARLLHPHFDVTLDGDRVRLPESTGLGGDIRFERISVEDGALTIRDPLTGRAYDVAGLDLEASAPSLLGPFKGEGRFGRGDAATAFRFSTAAYENDRLRFKSVIDESKALPRIEIDGGFAFDPDHRSLPALDARFAVSGRSSGTIALPWRLAGSLHAGLRAARLDDLDLRLGDDDHSVNLAGRGDVDLGARPHAHVAISAKQVNLDRLLTEKGAPGAARRFAAAVADFIAAPPATAIPVALDWSAESVLLGDEAFDNVAGSLGPAGAMKLALKLRAGGPGDSEVQLDGKVETGSAPAFDGNIEAGVHDVRRLQVWIASNLPQVKDSAASLPFRSFEVSGSFNLSPVGFFGSGLRLRFDRSTLTGTLAFTRAVGSEPPRVFADVSAEALDIDHLPDLRAAVTGLGPMDVSLRLDSRAIKVADVGRGPIDAGRLQLKFTKAGPRMSLEKFDIAGLGGTDMSATGAFDGKAGHVDAKLDAENLTAAAALLRRLVPGPAAEILAARTKALAPAHLELSAGVQGTDATDADSVTLSALSLKGTAAQTRFSAKLTPNPANRQHVTFTGHVDAAETSDLFVQLGLAGLPIRGLGAAQIDVTAEGDAPKPLNAQVAATLAGAKIDFHGTLLPDLSAPQAAGAIQLSSRDLSGLVQATAIAFPDLTGSLPADLGAQVDWRGSDVALHKLAGSLAGVPIRADLAYSAAPQRKLSGSLDLDKVSLANFFELALGPSQGAKPGQTWSDAAFTTGLIDPPAATLSITAKSLALWPGLVGRDAKLDLDLTSDEAGPKLALRLVYAKLGAGGAEADLALRRDHATASAEGHVTLQDYGVDLPSLAGSLSAELDFASTGSSAAALVSGLAGSGSLGFTNLVLPHSDPRALARIFAAVESDQLGVDQGEIDRALTREFDKQPLSLPSAEFDAGLAAGIFRLTPKPGAAPASPAPDQKISLDLQANVDLRSVTLEQRATLALGALPKNWKGAPPQVGLVWTGPLARPTRTLATATFVNALAARAIARESSRIEMQEFDLHERAFFRQRLHSERRREEERVKAEEDARRAAEEAKRAAEDAKRAADLAAGASSLTPPEHKSDDHAPYVPQTPPPLRPLFEPRRTSPLPPLRPPGLPGQ